ncbi:hypothetical protein C8R47DRAFT_1067268 [Mycena vitilis]|nr:hypothetical protein C8R47DRAFT_1067268 [Mycena vitilis]
MSSHTKEDADTMQVAGSKRLEGPDIVEQNEDSDDNMPGLEELEVESDDDDENNTLDLERRAAVWATTAASRWSSAFLHGRLTAARRGLPDLRSASANLQKGEPNLLLTMPLMAIEGNFRLKPRISYDVAWEVVRNRNVQHEVVSPSHNEMSSDQTSLEDDAPPMVLEDGYNPYAIRDLQLDPEQVEWLGRYWKRVNLTDLGYVYREGHEGLDCPNPGETTLRHGQGLRGPVDIWVQECLCNQ